jgi:regulator of replication initiation timing
MEDVIKVNISMIKNMDMEHSFGQMEENILDIGKMVNSMVEENTFYQMVRKRLDNGCKERR